MSRRSGGGSRASRPACCRRSPRSMARSRARGWRSAAARRHAGCLRRQPDGGRRRQDAGGDCGGADAGGGDRRPFLLSRGYGGALRGRCGSIRRGTALPTWATNRCCWRASRRPSWRATASPARRRARGGRRRHRDGRRLPESGAAKGPLRPGGGWPARHRQRPGVSGRSVARAAGSATSRAHALWWSAAAKPATLSPARRAAFRCFTAGSSRMRRRSRCLRARPVLAFAGIGDPDKFFATLRDAGVEVGATARLPRPSSLSPSRGERSDRRADRDGLTLVTTEKDLARLPGRTMWRRWPRWRARCR